MIGTADRKILRNLARRVAEIAQLPAMAERRASWKQHNSLRTGRPMLLIFPEGSWCELLPTDSYRCQDPRAREIEFELRHRIYSFEHFQTDNVVEAEWIVRKVIRSTGWGLEMRHRPAIAERGSWTFDPVLRDERDLEKLRFPEISHDEQATQRALEEAQELFAGILDVKLRGIGHLSFHLMKEYTNLRGLEQAMVDMCERPRFMHEAMRFLEEGNRRIIRQYERLNLLSLNNDNTYQSSGGVSYTDELPGPAFDPEHVRPRDLWASAESQEMAQVSPRMHEEFATQCESRLLAPFGLNGYGCCENLTRKLDFVLRIPNIRRISIAPTANVAACAEKLGNQAIFSWKPDPTIVVGAADPKKLRAYIQHTLDVTRGCTLEIILKDTHTCDQHPERFDIWSAVARGLVDACH